METKVFFQFETIKNVLVALSASFEYPHLWVFGHYKYFNYFSAGNLTSLDFRFWRLKKVPALKNSDIG